MSIIIIIIIKVLSDIYKAFKCRLKFAQSAIINKNIFHAKE